MNTIIKMKMRGNEGLPLPMASCIVWFGFGNDDINKIHRISNNESLHIYRLSIKQEQPRQNRTSANTTF